MIHLTRLAAIELAPRRITVNAVSPGTIRTPAVTEIADNPEIPFIERRTPLGRLGEPEEVAALCHFLASDEAAYITGPEHRHRRRAHRRLDRIRARAAGQRASREVGR